MKRKKLKKTDDLDTETTFANMNVEGFRWYRPNKSERAELSREESKAMLKGALAAMAPAVIGAVAVFLLIAGLAYLWLS